MATTTFGSVLELRLQILSNANTILRSLPIQTSIPGGSRQVMINISRAPKGRPNDAQELPEYRATVVVQETDTINGIAPNKDFAFIQGNPSNIATGALEVLLDATCELMYDALMQNGMFLQGQRGIHDLADGAWCDGT